MYKAYKTRLNVNNCQRTHLNRCAGVARYVYNWGLAEWQRRYQAGEKTSAMKLSKDFNALKYDACPFVTEVPYAVSEAAFRNLDAAFQNFFRRVKQGADKAGYPKFKSRHGQKSFQVRGVKIFSDRIYFPKYGYIRLAERGYIPVDADYGTYATFGESGGHWYISVLVDDGLPEPDLRGGDVLGVDVGIKSLAVFSDGKAFDNPKSLYAAERKLKRLQRELSRRQKGGKNREKTKAKLAKAHRKVVQIRQHAHHQVSNYAVKPGVGTVVIEDLNIAGMMSNHHLAKAVADAGMGGLHLQVRYKTRREGVEVVTADRWYPSSKTCSNCGHVMDITLADRVLHCPACGHVTDRDHNAARNLRRLGEPSNRRGLPVEPVCTNAPL